MAQQKLSERGPWNRIRLWMHRNRRIMWVVLLIVVCFSFGFVGPVQDFFSYRPDRAAVAEVYGKGISQADWTRTYDRLGTVRSVLGTARFGALPRPLVDATMALDRLRDPLDYLVFREKAARLGFRVSDGELGDCVRAIYRRLLSFERAGEEIRKLAPPKDRNEAQQRQWEMFSIAQQKEEELKTQPFDPNLWSLLLTKVNDRDQGHRPLAEYTPRRRAKPAPFESTLRDCIAIGKLESYIQSSVKLSAREVYEEYERQKQTRTFRWAEIPFTDDLRAKVKGTVSEEDIVLYFDSNRESFEVPNSIKASWLLLPRSHFEEIAAGKITDESLARYYSENRNDYRRPTVLAEEAQFALRSAEAQAAFENAIYQPLDDVRDKVQEKVLERDTRREILDFANELKGRLFPPKPAEGIASQKPATFADLAGEFAFLKTGTTGYVPEKEAEGAFGDAFSPQIRQWFSTLDRGDVRPRLQVPENAVSCEKGMVFYADVDNRRPTVPPLADVREKVRDAIAGEKARQLVQKAVQDLSRRIEAGEQSLDGIADLTVDVAVGDEKIPLEAKPLESAPHAIGRDGKIPLASAAAEADPQSAAGAKDEDAEEESHPASPAILAAVFRVSDVGKTDAAVSAETAAAYIVVLDGITLPDPKGFDEQKATLEAQLLRSRQQSHFDAWRVAVRREAQGRIVGYEEEEEEEDGAAS